MRAPLYHERERANRQPGRPATLSKRPTRSLTSVDTLEFKGVATYADRLKSYQEETGLKDAVTTGTAKIHGHSIGLAVMDFNFLAATMGSVVGEKITRTIELSTRKKWPVVIVCASGGARMYEGMLSLMQMAKTSGALALHSEAGLPCITILTHPTTAGVMASYASLGRYHHRRAQEYDRICGPARHQRNDSPGSARRISDGGISREAWADRRCHAAFQTAGSAWSTPRLSCRLQGSDLSGCAGVALFHAAIRHQTRTREYSRFVEESGRSAATSKLSPRRRH